MKLSDAAIGKIKSRVRPALIDMDGKQWLSLFEGYLDLGDNPREMMDYLIRELADCHWYAIKAGRYNK